MEIRYPSSGRTRRDSRRRAEPHQPRRDGAAAGRGRLSRDDGDSGAAAIAELYRLPIDLVLAELNMPRMSGAELARAIRGEVQWNDIPVMLITGKSEAKGAVRAYEAGADDVILKPFHFEVLIARIGRRIAARAHFKRLQDDNAALDARVVERAIQIGELREELKATH